MSGLEKRSSHTTVERRVFHKCNLLTTFPDDVTRYYDRIHYLNRFHTTSYNTYHEAVSVTHLVKVEIVSPYYGILINTGVGNPTAPSIAALGDKRVLPGKWGRLASSAHIKG